MPPLPHSPPGRSSESPPGLDLCGRAVDWATPPFLTPETLTFILADPPTSEPPATTSSPTCSHLPRLEREALREVVEHSPDLHATISAPPCSHLPRLEREALREVVEHSPDLLCTSPGVIKASCR